MRFNTKLNPPQSTTLGRLRISLGQFGPRPVQFNQLLAAMTSAVDLLESPQATEAQLRACDRAIERAERGLSRWAPAPRPSPAKAASKLSDVIDAVLLVPRFGAAPMSRATVREIQLRASRPAGRAAIIKAIQRRRRGKRSRDKQSPSNCDACVKESAFSRGSKLRESMKKARGGRQSLRESRSIGH
jgi:hypothetical protein